MSRSSLPLPRNVVEIPLYVFLRWGFWPPIQLVLGLPYRDLDDRFSAYGARVVRMDPSTGAKLDPEHAAALAAVATIEEGDCAGADFVFANGRAPRRGPKRSSNSSMQLIVDIGLEREACALAWILLWRDLGIMQKKLGVDELMHLDSAWHMALVYREENVHQQKVRLRKKGASTTAQWMPQDVAGLREAAMICARGAAACCGGANADRLIEDALARYAQFDGELPSIQLPEQDLYRYHHAVRAFVPYFSQPGAPLADYSDERTHLLISGVPPKDADAADLEAWVASGEIEL